MQKHLLCFGFGYTAQRVAQKCREQGWRVSATTRSKEKKFESIDTYVLSEALSEMEKRDITHCLISIPPNQMGQDVIYDPFGQFIKKANLEWLGYLSSTGVYGDTKGAYVDETAPCHPVAPQGCQRLKIEKQWLDLCPDVPTHIFRLAGIYGPGRNILERIQSGYGYRIHKDQHVMNRIHVDDIVSTLWASMIAPHAGEIYNVADDEPTSQERVYLQACRLLKRRPDAAIPWSDPQVSDALKRFFEKCIRVDNSKIKHDLNVQLQYPTYREGLQSLLSTVPGIPHDDFEMVLKNRP